jgi:alkanesulfonate monooxygenase SsuD/methylene tetrahydromethanopterin reductase-like flavin-dependent oxidoreductase (luciferase family)
MTSSPRANAVGMPFAAGSVSLRLYPHTDLDATALLDELRLQAVLADAHGFDGVMTSEHHGGFPGYLPNPLQLAGFLLHDMPSGWAAPCPLLLPLRSAALVAEEVAWLAMRFPGRVGLGVAAGALPLDFEIADASMDDLTSRFAQGLDLAARALRGAADGPLASDPAIAQCLAAPVPVVSAAASLTAARRATACDVGLLFDSLVTAARVRELADAYQLAGGTRSCVLVRRVWLGPPPRAEVERQVDVYRDYAPGGAPSHWGGDEMITSDNADDVSATVAGVMRAAGADALNIRVHVPGLSPSAVREQITRIGDEVIPRLRALLDA